MVLFLVLLGCCFRLAGLIWLLITCLIDLIWLVGLLDIFRWFVFVSDFVASWCFGLVIWLQLFAWCDCVCGDFGLVCGFTLFLFDLCFTLAFCLLFDCFCGVVLLAWFSFV